MSKKNKAVIVFSLGAIFYGIIELMWRGYTHWSMLCAGGVSFMGISNIAERLKNRCLFIKAMLGSAFITAVEFVFGVIFNIILKKNVWDYSKQPLNFKGQICAVYSLLWTLLCLIAVPVAEKLTLHLNKPKGNKKDATFTQNVGRN